MSNKSSEYLKHWYIFQFSQLGWKAETKRQKIVMVKNSSLGAGKNGKNKK